VASSSDASVRHASPTRFFTHDTISGAALANGEEEEEGKGGAHQRYTTGGKEKMS